MLHGADVLIRERVPHHPAVQAERAAVGGVHFLAFRAPLVRHWFVNCFPF